MARRLFTAFAIVVLAVMLSAGCAQQGAQGEGDVIKIGATMPLSGVYANEGSRYARGYELWEAFVNSQGGIKVGGKTYKVRLILYDDKSDPQTAAKLTERLITEDKVNFLLASATSGVVEAASSIAERYRVIMIAPVANAEKLYTRGYKYLFGQTPRAGSNVSTILEMAKEKGLDVKKVAIVTEDSLFPVAGAEGIKEVAQKYGWEITDYIKYPPANTELSTVAAQVKAKNPDAVLNPSNFQQAIMFLKALKEQGFKPKLIGLQDAPGQPEFVSTLAQDAEQITGTAWWWPGTNKSDPLFGSTDNFVKLYREKYTDDAGRPIFYGVACSASAAEILQLAVQEAGSLDTEKVRQVLLNKEFETLYMKVRFGQVANVNQINVVGKPVVLQIQNGKPVPVYPDQVKEAEFIFPRKH